MEPATETDQLRAKLAERDATIAMQAKAIAAHGAKLGALEFLVTRLIAEQGRNSKNSNLPPWGCGPRRAASATSSGG